MSAEFKEDSREFAPSPIEELQLNLNAEETFSLPVVLRSLLEGTSAEQLRILSLLHKRRYHRQAPEMRSILHRAGIPHKCLALIDDAVNSCTECRRWKAPHANPAVKVRLASQFNSLVYLDLIFVGDPQMVFLVALDDCIRWIIVKHTEYKSFESLTSVFRQGWLSLFGPPQRVRCDSESAFSNDSFGIFCESLGIQRELIIAKDGHSLLSPIDRKIKIIRIAAPRLIDALAEDSVRISAPDLASELQYSINAQMSYGGVSAYQCLFGAPPREFFNDEIEELSVADPRLPFFEMLHIRQKSMSTFHAALLRYRLESSLKKRARSDMSQSYSIGQLIDIFLKSPKKDLEGWRGHGVILGFQGEGRATVRWQSVIRDLPFNLIRPHLQVLSSSALPRIASGTQAVQDAVNNVGALASSSSSSSSAAHAAFAVNVFDETVVDTSNELAIMCQARNSQEVFFSIDSCDQLKRPFLDALLSLASSLQTGNQQLHAVDTKNQNPVWSRDSIRDQSVIYGIGHRFAREHGVDNYCGVILQAGRRFVTAMQDVQTYHAVTWTDADFLQVHVFDQAPIDWIREGVCTIQNLHLLRCVVFLSARREIPPLTELLANAREIDVADDHGPRVREEWPDTLVVPTSEDHEDPGPSVSERDINEEQEVFIAINRLNNLLHPKELACPLVLPKYDTVFTTESSAMEVYLIVVELGGEACPLYFPLDKDVRELTSRERTELGPEIRAAKLKELSSWVKLRAGVPVRITAYRQATGLRPMPTRWVETYKRKLGKRVIKERFVVKGYAEQRQERLVTCSPTATRTSHRLVKTTSASRKWPLWLIDVSAAFLRGFDFEELNSKGHERQPVAITLDPETLQLLAEIDPVWAEAAASPDLFCMQLQRGAYGLKDAPFLWYLRFRSFMLGAGGMVQSKHDPCLFFQVTQTPAPGTLFPDLALMLSLHVDDNLLTGFPVLLECLYQKLLDSFEDVSLEKDHFRHFGVDVWRDPVLGNVYDSQADYLKAIEPIKLPTTRIAADTPATPDIVTNFRSVVAGIAWVGVTYAPALTAGSLFQGYLPCPTIGQCRQVNLVLQQLRDEYQPTIYRADLVPPLRLVPIADSSLGNSSASNKSQGGFYIMLANRSELHVCGSCNQLAFKSCKSKRVASSTSHAEVLASMLALEEASFLQTWILELTFPRLTSLELLAASSDLLVPIVAVGDCKDAFDLFTKPAVPTPTNRSMTLYVQACREFHETGKLEAFVWCDTKCNIANVLTKFNQSGLLEIDEFLKLVYASASWEPVNPFRWQTNALTDPEPLTRTIFPPPMPPTKEMNAQTFKPPAVEPWLENAQ